MTKKTFTYVGSGDTPPSMTHFMGQVHFRRGEPVEVEDELIIKKLNKILSPPIEFIFLN